ncbi:apolipoprotein N-acyltransferase [Flavobacterium sp. NKUCC04_CG]|uniref:apolipoprotein N-acyltransferase n=1 Tax=Flavobacterium sp. NKUCC04_CG TaxID=2842121 RepID=UPI001C5AA546|nr:apolipoprotein N-acyltransferase [Flavobacterium sp. NKUCC04_CG]MBW3519023.1 apolipoprotein N-acyltransferase [Flavobacterium sp. NKUCC04_CG]
MQIKQLITNQKQWITYILLLIIVFLAWNYFGLLFILYLYFLLKHFDKAKDEKFTQYVLKSIILLTIWHLGVLFWMIPIENGEGILGFIGNLIYYLLFFIIIYFIRNRIKSDIFLVIPLWLIFEHLTELSPFSFPWLTIGNVLSTNTSLIQWFEYTGVLGGSFWLWYVTYSLYMHKKHITLVLLLPLLISFYLLYNNKSTNKVHHENFTYITFNSEKYFAQNPYQDNNKHAFYIRELMSFLKSDAIVIPEQTFRGILYDKINNELFYSYLNDLLNNHSTTEIHMGITAINNTNAIVNAFVSFNKDKHYLKTKKKLIPYTEYLPQKISKSLRKTSFHPNISDSLISIKKDLKTSPLICYESIYSHFVANDSSDSNLILLITSESFFQQSNFGMNQYNNILALRAIENRLPILKASNYGHSLLINKTGKVIHKTKDEIGIFKITKEPIHDGTFYIKFTNRYIFSILLIYTCFLFLKKYIINKFNYVSKFLFYLLIQYFSPY